MPTKIWGGQRVSGWLAGGSSLAWGLCLFWGAGCADGEMSRQPAAAPAKSETTAPIERADPMQIANTPLPQGSTPKMEPMLGAAFPELGSTAFETAKDVDDGSRRPSRGGDFDDGRAETAGDAVPPPAGPTATAPATAAPVPAAGNPGVTPGAAPQQPRDAAGNTASSAAMREIVEADVVQAQGDVLYVLNRYRGLVLIDMSQPDSPYVIGRVPFQAVPVDMYLRDKRAYIVMSDYFSYWQWDKGADPQGFHGSQLLVVDVTNPARPETLTGFPIDGQVTDTRIVGDVLYSVSKRNPEYWRYDVQDWKDTTWVMSIDISDVANIRQVEKQEFPGAANLIQVYETALSIAALDPNYYLTDEDNAQQTLITLVDISDPKGAIKVGGKAYVPGSVQDKFKMDLSGGALRVISQNWYWRPETAATLTVFDASDPAKLVQRAQIAVANDVPSAQRYVQPQATRFAGTSMFINLCWYDVTQQRCRMDLYDLKVVDKPERVASLDVDGDVTHFEVRGQRLLSLGRHYVYNQPSPVQIALYDVADLRTARRLAAVDLGNDWSGSEALNDYKAFKVLEDQHMLLLPLNWVQLDVNGARRGVSGAQIVDWQNDQLTVRGRLAQAGQVERVLSFRDRVISVSTKQVQVIDARDRDRPVATANLFLVRTVLDVFDIKGYQVQLAADEEDNQFRFYVLPFGEDDMAKSVAELPVDGYVQYQIRSGDIVHLIGFTPGPGQQTIRNADFSDPLKPRWRGRYDIPQEIQHIYNGGYASYYDHYWNINAGQPLENDLLPVTVRVVNAAADGRRFYKNYLRILDLRNADAPRLAAGSIEMPEYPFVNKVSHGKILYSTHTEPALDKNGNPKLYHERYFLDRVDASDPEKLVVLPKINIPGRLVDVDASGKLLYTVDYQWDEQGRRRNSFNVLHLEGDKASLNTVLPVGDEIDRARYLDREVWLSTHSYPWYGRNDDSPDSRQPYTRLTRLRFDEQAKLQSMAAHNVDGYHFDLLDVVGDDVYLASSYPTGLLVLDTSDFANPTVLGAARTVGYVSKIVHNGDYLYFPMRSYGVRRMQAVR